jgi:hypothetical protein
MDTFGVLVVDPKRTSTLYGVSAGLWKSIDSGHSWTPIGAGIPDASESIAAVAVDPVEDETIYVGTAAAACIAAPTAGSISPRSTPGSSRRLS